MPSEREPGSRAFLEGPGAVSVGSVRDGRTTGASGTLDDDRNADVGDHLPLTGTDANRVVGVDRDAG